MAAQPGSPETLLIRFKTRILPLGVNQVVQLNKVGNPAIATAGSGGSVRVLPTRPEVLEQGSRPFPRAESLDGSTAIDVSLHTKIVECLFDVPPVVQYARGILTVAMLCSPSETEFADPANADWVGGARATAERATWTPASNGSDDDTPPLPREPQQ
jgi:hypothetical protein